MDGSDEISGPFFIPKTGGTLYMADDKNIKTPDIPAADTGPGTGPVSYTHLDVYKRQVWYTVEVTPKS